MAARLKVFITTDGLTDYVVAASSKPKALAAWGSHQDLFQTGLAHQTDDPELVKAATAQPGEVLRRPARSRAALAQLKPDATKAPRAKPAGPTKAQLKRVADAEARLVAADEAHASALADLEARRAGLEARHAKARAKLEAAVSAAKRATAPR
ncbi:MAG: hypothetical protein DI570_16600 [Phenylobacterium zucineum]|nr:MAG: hypothetical protein DI570_16600 [Phenylobacterium zucineum]